MPMKYSKDVNQGQTMQWPKEKGHKDKDDKLLVISLVEYKMGTEMKDSVKCIFL
jgi:hypothetical protein